MLQVHVCVFSFPFWLLLSWKWNILKTIFNRQKNICRFFKRRREEGVLRCNTLQWRTGVVRTLFLIWNFCSENFRWRNNFCVHLFWLKGFGKQSFRFRIKPHLGFSFLCKPVVPFSLQTYTTVYMETINVDTKSVRTELSLSSSLIILVTRTKNRDFFGLRSSPL